MFKLPVSRSGTQHLRRDLSTLTLRVNLGGHLLHSAVVDSRHPVDPDERQRLDRLVVPQDPFLVHLPRQVTKVNPLST